ncbi:MAG: Tetratricopeptide 1 repeat-containing protein [Bacteroidota bacterium]|jgi:tetratricopeptide (TPR) repeat protein|nr:Tetratricopeptide 1 repeat-containing protein [Bacteroidota bacterium]
MKKNKQAAVANKIPKAQKVQLQVEKKVIYRFALLLAVFAFLLYSNTLNHGYVLDDTSIIKDNRMTQGGTSSLKEIFTSAYRAGNINSENDLYRPLSKAMFAVEWQLSPENPFLSHFMNVMLYAFCCAVLFIVLLRWTGINIHILFFTVLLFAAHPIHTEVVANIKSRDEILAMLFILFSLNSLYKYLESKKALFFVGYVLCFFLALLSKESAIVYVAIAPLFIWFFTEKAWRENIKLTLSVAVTAILYLFLHKSIIGGIALTNIPVIDNSLMATTDTILRKATAIFIMSKYLLLLIFPHPLSSDYSYNTIPLVSGMGDPKLLFSLLVHLGMLIYAIKKFREKHILSFCILFYLVSMAIASNIFMIIGTHLAERLLFFPSIAFCLALAWLFSKLFKLDYRDLSTQFVQTFRSGKGFVIVCATITLLFSVKTFARNKDWKSNGTLFKADIEKVPESAHMLMYYTDYLINKEELKKLSPEARKARLLQAQGYIRRALKIYELFPDAHYLNGRISYELNDYETAYKEYLRALTLNPSKAMYHNNAGTALFSSGNYMAAAEEFKKAMTIDPLDADPPFNLGSAYGAMGEVYKSRNEIENANKMFNEAIPNFEKAIQLNPQYKSAYKFLGATYVNMGNPEKGKPYLEKAEQLK